MGPRILPYGHAGVILAAKRNASCGKMKPHIDLENDDFRGRMRRLGVQTGDWLPSGALPQRSRGPLLGGVWLHCHTRWRAHKLDAALAAGANPIQSDELSLRVGQLRSASSRTRVAAVLRGAVELAQRQSDPLRVPPPDMRRAIRENRTLLLELAARIAADDFLGAEGLAASARLVHDRTSPLNSESASHSLATRAQNALDALEGHAAENATED